MKNKWTLSLTIFTITAASIALLFIILELVGFQKLHALEMSNINRSYGGTTQEEYNRNVSIVSLIFQSLSLGIAILGILFYKRMDSTKFKVWFFASMVISLSLSFGITAYLLSTTYNTFREISDLNSIPDQAVQATSANNYTSIDQSEIDMKPWMLLIAYLFAFKATLATITGLGIIGTTVMGLREFGYGLETSAPEASSKYQTKPKSMSSKKLQASLEAVTQAKSLLDSKVITKAEFDKIKERELKL